ncbi:hypothetical protein C2E23DRAFT_38515 [Lenzites betulinus]|nr:hypothetical protein C2E23DRAFT_38515 [Lenzites betulinus]
MMNLHLLRALPSFVLVSGCASRFIHRELPASRHLSVPNSPFPPPRQASIRCCSMRAQTRA